MRALVKQNSKIEILVLNLPGPILKSGSRWYNKTNKGTASLRYYPYPWFMGYLVSLLKSKGFNAVLIDAVAMEWTDKQTQNFIKRNNPKYLICEPTWNSINDDKNLLDSLDKNIIKIAVGNYATNFPLECLKKIKINYVVVGEYEFSLLEFFQNNKEKLPINFVSRKKTYYQYPKLVSDLDLFPFPERDDTLVTYYNEPSCFGKNIVMVSSRGCRLKCSFCNVECIYGKHTYRTRSAQNVVDEIIFLQKKYKFDEIYFDDDNMVSSKEHIENICNEIIKRKIKVRWLCMGDGLVEDSTLILLKKAGCATYKYGLEHLDKEVLNKIPKPLDPERLLEIIKKCKNIGLKSYVNLMVGLLGSSYDIDLKMIKKVIEANPDLIQISIATPYPGTLFYKQAKMNKWLLAENLGQFDAREKSVVSYPNYSSDEINEVYNNAWSMWYRHVLLKKPKTLLFFISSEIRRNGYLNTIMKLIYYCRKIIVK